MFHSARLKLTAWYLIIIVLISFLFSLVIYKGADRELDRIARRQHLWSQHMPDFFKLGRPDWFEPIDVNEIRRRIIFMLILVNSGILIISGAAGYFLAGRTLDPIKEMVDEQNRFIADASHELRTPLTALKTATEVGLRDNKITQKGLKNLLQDNLESIDSLQSLSDSLLQLAQFEKPNGKTPFSSILLTEVFRLAKKKVEPLARAKKIIINIPLVKYQIEGDKNSLVNLIKIILDNAIKYSPTGSRVEMSAKISDSSVIIQIKDQGIGIEKRDLLHIFDRFYRADKSRSNSDGYGLGLSIAKKIAEMHQGSITLTTSVVGQGTTVSIQLPLKHI